MPSSTTRKRNVSGEDSPTSNKRELINRVLKVQLQTFPQKELFAEEIGNWERDLDHFTVEQIEWAFDCWRRNGRWFPVYGDIIDLCIAYEPPTKSTHQPGCSRECKERHWRGYSGQDMIILYELYNKKIAAEKRPKDKPLTDAEMDLLLDQLDKHRGKAPGWRA